MKYLNSAKQEMIFHKKGEWFKNYEIFSIFYTGLVFPDRDSCLDLLNPFGDIISNQSKGTPPHKELVVFDQVFTAIFYQPWKTRKFSPFGTICYKDSKSRLYMPPRLTVLDEFLISQLLRNI